VVVSKIEWAQMQARSLRPPESGIQPRGGDFRSESEMSVGLHKSTRQAKRLQGVVERDDQGVVGRNAHGVL
jgi:hypothetical protein